MIRGTRNHAKACTPVIRFPRESGDNFRALTFPRYANCNRDKTTRSTNSMKRRDARVPHDRKIKNDRRLRSAEICDDHLGSRRWVDLHSWF